MGCRKRGGCACSQMRSGLVDSFSVMKFGKFGKFRPEPLASVRIRWAIGIQAPGVDGPGCESLRWSERPPSWLPHEIGSVSGPVTESWYKSRRSSRPRHRHKRRLSIQSNDEHGSLCNGCHKSKTYIGRSLIGAMDDRAGLAQRDRHIQGI